MKVRFEVDVDYPDVIEGFPHDRDEIFRDADGKVFLYRDNVTQALHVCVCERGITDSNTCAQLAMLMLPVNARIIDSDKYEQEPIERTYSVLIDGIQAIMGAIKESRTAILDNIGHGTVSAEGVSEDTLLEALRIVSHRREE